MNTFAKIQKTANKMLIMNENIRIYLHFAMIFAQQNLFLHNICFAIFRICYSFLMEGCKVSVNQHIEPFMAQTKCEVKEDFLRTFMGNACNCLCFNGKGNVGRTQGIACNIHE